MTVLYLVIGFLSGVVVAVCYNAVRLARRVREQGEILDRTRSATYELTTMAQDDISDLRDSLRAAGITLSTEHVVERMRRRALTPEESLAEFEAVVARFEAGQP